ncbi:MAG: hypothetical protein ACE5H1_06350, partial [Thermodesulfobacteriota bacterium]
SKLLAGATLAGVIHQLLGNVAIHGKTMIDGRSIETLLEKLVEVLTAGINRAEKELGTRIDIPSLPKVLSDLVTAWARGDITNIDPEDSNFKKLFAELSERAAA